MFSMKPQRGQVKTFGDIFEFLSKPGVGISTVFQAAAHRVSNMWGSGGSGELSNFIRLASKDIVPFIS